MQAEIFVVLDQFLGDPELFIVVISIADISRGHRSVSEAVSHRVRKLTWIYIMIHHVRDRKSDISRLKFGASHLFCWTLATEARVVNPGGIHVHVFHTLSLGVFFVHASFSS